MTTTSKSIICCGFTPCIQRIIEFSDMEKGGVNRAQRVTVGIGGKGANTARMIKQLGGAPVLLGFAGGNNGKTLERMLDAQEIDYEHVRVSGETRICQTLVEQGNPETTELVEEMPAIDEAEWSRMLALIDSLDLSGAVVAISGKLPAGAPLDAYAGVCRRVHEKGGRVILDAPGKPLWLSLEHQPDVVKINDEELLQTVGGNEMLPACKKLLNNGAGSVLITRGAKTAFYVDSLRVLELIPPPINAVNPVGSGDAVTAGIAFALQAGKSVDEALINGMACGAANALNLISGCIQPEDVARLRGEVILKPVGK